MDSLSYPAVSKPLIAIRTNLNSNQSQFEPISNLRSLAENLIENLSDSQRHTIPSVMELIMELAMLQVFIWEFEHTKINSHQQNENLDRR